MTTRAKKWNGNLLPRNFSSFGRKTFHIYFWPKVRMKVFLASVTNLTSFVVVVVVVTSSVRKGSFCFSNGLKTHFIYVLFTRPDVLLHQHSQREKGGQFFCPYLFKGFYFARILAELCLVFQVDTILFPFHQKDSKAQHFFLLKF